MNRVELQPGYSISPVIKGGWQLSEGHSLNQKIEGERAVADTVAFVENGISTLDFGDIYTGVEELIGKAIVDLKKKHGETARQMVQLHTKYVPNQTILDNYDTRDVEKIVDRSLSRLGVDQLDLVQFHWWKYEARSYIDALAELFRLKAKGKIRHVGVTNFDLTRLEEFVVAGLTPASIQLQYSVLDRRPAGETADFCIAHGISILCYGTVAGGFLSNKYLGAPDPKKAETRSNTKYRLIIDEFGGWDLFQELLSALDSVARAHGTDIGSVASAWTLAQPGVKAVIVGARNITHLEQNLGIPAILLSEEESALIDGVLSRSQGPSGPVYDLERYNVRHSSIMHTNNN
jgi:aryl-alcohol dehydrogenase-like predicted oxidoreductase